MKIILFFFVYILFVFSLQSFDCNNKKPVELTPKSDNLEKDTILKIALDTAIKVYGYGVIRDELPLVANMKNDSVWVVKGTLRKGAKGGTVYIEIRRGDNELLKITHYK